MLPCGEWTVYKHKVVPVLKWVLMLCFNLFMKCFQGCIQDSGLGGGEEGGRGGGAKLSFLNLRGEGGGIIGSNAMGGITYIQQVSMLCMYVQFKVLRGLVTVVLRKNFKITA